MAKQRRTNSIVSAISAVTSAIRAETDPNLTADEKAIVIGNAMNIVDNSGVMTMAEHADDNIETKRQVDEILERAGIDPVQLDSDNAIAGANRTVEIKALADADEDDTEPQELDGVGAPDIEE